MDTCAIVNISAQTVVLLASIVSLVDCVRRHIPRVITGFRVLLTVYSVLTILRTIATAESYVIAAGVLTVLSIGVVWPLCLYFLEHFARVFLTIDLKDRNKDLSKLFTAFTVARISIFVLYTILAIAFGLVPVNGVVFGGSIITLGCDVFVVLPVCGTILSLTFALRAHRKESCSFDTDSDRALKATYRQLVAFFVILSSSCLIGLVTTIRAMIVEVAYLDAPWEPPVCTTGAAFYRTTIPFILGMYLTRFPNAQRRLKKFSSEQDMSSSSHDSASSKRSQLKPPTIPTICVGARRSSELQSVERVVVNEKGLQER